MEYPAGFASYRSDHLNSFGCEPGHPLVGKQRWTDMGAVIRGQGIGQGEFVRI